MGTEEDIDRLWEILDEVDEVIISQGEIIWRLKIALAVVSLLFLAMILLFIFT